jgi:hypothetical protein
MYCREERSDGEKNYIIEGVFRAEQIKRIATDEFTLNQLWKEAVKQVR